MWTKLKDGTYLNQANILSIEGGPKGSLITLATPHPDGLYATPWTIETDEPLATLMKRVINDADGVSAMMRRKHGMG